MTPDPSDRDLELDRQAEIVNREFVERMILNLLSYALCLVYLPATVAAALAIVNLGSEAHSYRISRDVAWRRSEEGRRATLLCIVMMEAAFTLAASLVWMVDDPYAKAFAVGMIMTTLLHLTSVRSIHLPYGLAGLGSVAFVAGTANLWFWLGTGNLVGLAVSSTCMLGALSYTLTAMLSNNGVHRAMRQEQARASRADAAKSRFLAVLSHEIRTPLNTILGLARVVEDDLGPSPAVSDGPFAALRETCRKRIALLTRAARDMDAILADASDMSAIADGRLALRERPVDLLAELEAVLVPFAEQAGDAGSALVFAPDAALSRHVRIDPQRLRQCVTNLVSNALKHAGAGRVTVSAATRSGLIEITVADTGPGILPEEREQIFEPFRQGSTKGAGSGLGLAIARSLARQMGGDVRLVPVGPGATFRLTLPCRPVAAAEVEPPPSTVLPALPGRVALVVDDTATNRMVAAMLLRPTGMTVIEAEGGPQALAALAAGPVDIVFLDLNMPGMDGHETLTRIRDLPGPAAAVPVVAMTADMIALAAKGATRPVSGMDGVLLKPVEVEALATELNRHFGPAGAGGAARSLA